MLKTLVFAGLAAVVGNKLYKSGALDEFISDAKSRLGSSDRMATETGGTGAAPTPGATGPY